MSSLPYLRNSRPWLQGIRCPLAAASAHFSDISTKGLTGASKSSYAKASARDRPGTGKAVLHPTPREGERRGSQQASPHHAQPGQPGLILDQRENAQE